MEDGTRVKMVIVGGLAAAALGFGLAAISGTGLETARWVGAASGLITTVLLTFALWGAGR